MSTSLIVSVPPVVSAVSVSVSVVLAVDRTAASFVPVMVTVTEVETARQIGALPHDGDLLHRLFLYHMALNGIRVVRELSP